MVMGKYFTTTITAGMTGALALAFLLGDKHDFILSGVVGFAVGAILATIWMLPILVQYYVALFMKQLGQAMGEERRQAVGEPD